MSCVLDLCFQLFSNLFQSIILTCIVVTSRSTSMDEDCVIPSVIQRSKRPFLFGMHLPWPMDTDSRLASDWFLWKIYARARGERFLDAEHHQCIARNSNRTTFSLMTGCWTLLHPEIPVYGHPRVHQACKKYKMKYFKLIRDLTDLRLLGNFQPDCKKILSRVLFWKQSIC